MSASTSRIAAPQSYAQRLLRAGGDPLAFYLSRTPAFGVPRTAIESLSSFSIGSLDHLRPTSGAFREISFFLIGFFTDVLDVRTPRFLVGIQSAAAEYAGKIANLIFSEPNVCPRGNVVR